MPSRSKRLLAVAAFFGLALAPALPAAAAQTEGSDLIIITEDDVVSDDLYAAGNRVLIRGRVEGDLIAIASQDVRIEGEVTGSVTATASEVVVTGTVGGSLRSTAPSIVVDGAVERDVVAAAGSFELTAGGSVGGDLVLWAWNASIAGPVGSLDGVQRNLSLEGQVEGDVSVSARQLTITGPLAVRGDLTYRSRNEASGIDQAEIDGALVRQTPMPLNIRVRALGLAGQFVVALALIALALLVVWGWPERTEKALDSLRARPLRSFALGVVLMISPLLLIGVAFLIVALAPPSAALPLVGLMIPLILALAGLVLLVALVAGIPVAAWVGTRVRKNLTIAGAVGLGATLVAVVWLLPVVGWLVPLLTLTGGLGAWVNSFRSEARTEAGSA
jgi:cytoskeletal protein CcmA (bactofilin family)